MPFDYLTSRKVKRFYKDPIIKDMPKAMLDKEYAHSKYVSKYEEDEDEEE